MAMKENAYQSMLKRKISNILPTAIVIKTDDLQGFPDLIILNNYKWAALEIKRSRSASHRPNQNYWVDRLDEMSFAAFIYPENEEAVLRDLERALTI